MVRFAPRLSCSLRTIFVLTLLSLALGWRWNALAAEDARRKAAFAKLNGDWILKESCKIAETNQAFLLTLPRRPYPWRILPRDAYNLYRWFGYGEEYELAHQDFEGSDYW